MAEAGQAGRSRRRLLVRCGVLVVALVLAVPLVPWPDATLVLPAASPFVAGASALAARSAGAVALVAVPVLVLSLLRRRWFCRWACPTGLLAEHLGRLGRPSRLAKWPPLGQWAVLATLGGACLGYPVFLWLDPLTIFSAFFGAWRWPVTGAAVLAAVGLPLVLLLSAAAPGAWCARLCPLGGLQDLLASARRLVSRRSAGRQGPGEDGRALARRALFGLGAGVVAAMATRSVRGAATPLRPPGAVDEARFVGLCVRCGNCVRVCPPGILRPDLGVSGVTGLLTPIAAFDSGYCREDCHACTVVCPSGAIARLSLEAKRKQVMGEARVERTACLLAGGQECTACMTACPYEAIIREVSEDGYFSFPQVAASRCTGCGACEAACPTEPAKAIRVGAVSPRADAVKTRTDTPGGVP